MSTIEAKLDDILAHPLRAAWSCGGGAWGYVGLDIPTDLLGVPGRVSCHLPWKKHVSKLVASRWLETSFPGWAFSIVEDWAEGRFNCFEYVVFSRGHDAAQRLYYYICELQRRGRVGGPQPLMFDIAKIPRESSRRHTVASLRKLMQELGVNPEQLSSGVQRTNELRIAFSGLQRRRTGPGRLYEKLVRASLFDDVSGLLADWPSEKAQEGLGTVVLVGSAPPDDSLHTAVERAGWTVVEELYDRSMYRLGASVDTGTADPVRSVALGWLDQPPHSIAPRLRDQKIDAAILWSMREDESLAWRVPAQRAALETAGIPTLVLTARSWKIDDGAVEETQSFLRGLR
jgi:hypothetical protein